MSEARKLLKELLNRVIKKRKEDVVEDYLNRFKAIESLIEADMLAVNFEEIFVVFDSKIHMLYCNNDKKYLAFFDTLLAYINLNRGFLSGKGEKDLPMVKPEEAQINFLVTSINPHHKDKAVPTLVGWAKQKELRYVPWKEQEKKEESEDTIE